MWSTLGASTQARRSKTSRKPFLSGGHRPQSAAAAPRARSAALFLLDAGQQAFLVSLRKLRNVVAQNLLDTFAPLRRIQLQSDVLVAVQVKIHTNGGCLVGKARKSGGLIALGARATGAECTLGSCVHLILSSFTQESFCLISLIRARISPAPSPSGSASRMVVPAAAVPG